MRESDNVYMRGTFTRRVVTLAQGFGVKRIAPAAEVKDDG